MKSRDIYHMLKAIKRHKHIYCDDMPECEDCPLMTKIGCLTDSVMSIASLIKDESEGEENESN